MKCKAWVRHLFVSSVCDPLFYCDKALDHTGDHRNDDNLITWSQ